MNEAAINQIKKKKMYFDVKKLRFLGLKKVVLNVISEICTRTYFPEELLCATHCTRIFQGLSL